MFISWIRSGIRHSRRSEQVVAVDLKTRLASSQLTAIALRGYWWEHRIPPLAVMSAFRFTLLLIIASLAPLLAQNPAPRIAFSHTAEGVVIKLLDSGRAKSWCVEASSDLTHWVGLGEMMEINGAGDFLDPFVPLYKKRFYRAIDKGTDLQAALDRNRTRWEKSDLKNYDFTFRWICFCIPEFVIPVNISVRDGEITSISREGREVPASQFANYRTIDGLFDLLQGALDQNPYSITARFDPCNGAPGKARIDYLQFAIDEEQEFVVESLRIAAAAPVQISATPPDEIQLDPFSLLGATVRGNTLTIDLQHGGGCAEHEYELIMSPGAFLESFPVQASLYLRHNANGDVCRALIRKQLTFDLTPIGALHGHPADSIIFNVHDYFTEEPGEHISVRWERSAIQITNTAPAEIQLDPFWLLGATVDGDALTLSVEASGGCRPHTYELFMSPGSLLNSHPPQANLYIRHDGNDDPCDSIVRADLSFDLRAISDLHGCPGPIVLNIYEYFADTPGDPIRVTYE